jgi:hypothetical protein
VLFFEGDLYISPRLFDIGPHCYLLRVSDKVVTVSRARAAGELALTIPWLF